MLVEEELPRKENCNLKVIPLIALPRYSVSRYLDNFEHSVLATELSRLAKPCVDVLTAVTQLVKGQTVVKRKVNPENVSIMYFKISRKTV